jgi:formamidase
MAKYGIKNPIFKPPDHAELQRLSDLRRHLGRRAGKQHYLDVHIAYRQACLNAIEY